MSPGLHLRETLQLERGLTLAAFRTVLTVQYKLDSSSDLLHCLMNIPQDPKESAQNFLLRAIELKEKHMRKFSNEDEGEEFLRSVEMRLYSNTDTFQIRPYPCTLTVTDEVLIDKISEAATGAGKTTKTEKPT